MFSAILKKKILFFSCLFLGSFFLSESLSASDWEIHTFGGGELITNVLNMVKMILYGNSKTDLGAAFSGFAKIIFALGSVSAVIILIFKQNPLFYFKNFLIPSFFILNVLLLPRTNVIVHDDAIRNSSTTQLTSVSVVNDVPFLYGAFLSLLSELSYNFTKLLEQCTHQVNDRIYNWTGRIYAGEYALRLKNDYLFSKDLENNFREFCRTCVWNDLERGLYSRRDLMNSSNLLQFFKERTSNLNTVAYQTYDPEQGNKKEFLTCREAISAMTTHFDNKGVLKGPMDFIDKWLPKSSPRKNSQLSEIVSSTINSDETDLNFLLGKSQNNSLNSIRAQSGIIKMLKEELPGTQFSFTARRAEAQNREGMKTTGAIAASNLVTMKNVFEALLYFSFPLICLFSLIPLMQKLILSWMKACIWISTLSPFYVIINAILSLIWHKKKALMFGESADLTLYSHDGLLDLYDSMEAVAALTIGSIFTISLILTKSGFSGLSHALPSMFSSGQSAAQSAAAEKVTGNYSYQNVGLGNTHAYNFDSFKQNYSGSFSQGGLSMNEASQTIALDLANDEMFVHQESSRLRDSISMSEGFNHSVQTQLAQSETAVQEQGTNYNRSISESSNQAVGLMEAYSSHKQHGENISLSDLSSQQQTFQQIDNMARDYSKTHNVSYDQAVRDMIEAGAGWDFLLKGKFSSSGSSGSSSADSVGFSERFSEGESFVNLLQKASQYSTAEVGSFMDSKDLKKHEDFSSSWNETANVADHLRAAYSKQENLSYLEGDLKSDNLSVNKNLDQQFVHYLRDQAGGDMGVVKDILNLPSNHPEKQRHVDDFISEYKPDVMANQDISSQYKSYEKPIYEKTETLRKSETPDISQSVIQGLYQGSSNLDRSIDKLKSHKLSSNPQLSGGDLKSRGEELKESVKSSSKSPDSLRLKTLEKAKEILTLKNMNDKIFDPASQFLAVRVGKFKHNLASRSINTSPRFTPQGYSVHNYKNEEE